MNTVENNNKETPRYLYKYMSLDGFIEMITKGTLYFATPITYNDPFDTRADLEWEFSQEDKRLFWIKQGYDDGKINTLTQSQFKKLVNEAYIETIANCRVCCFSQISDNILMWSHYSNMHKGVCVKFDGSKDSLFDNSTLISYKDIVPKFNCITGTNEDVNHLIYTKSSDWEYEKEIRIVKHTEQGFSNEVVFKKKALKEVILGCRFPEYKKLAVQAIIKKYGYHVTLSQMDISEGEYKLVNKTLI